MVRKVSIKNTELYAKHSANKAQVDFHERSTRLSTNSWKQKPIEP